MTSMCPKTKTSKNGPTNRFISSTFHNIMSTETSKAENTLTEIRMTKKWFVFKNLNFYSEVLKRKNCDIRTKK